MPDFTIKRGDLLPILTATLGPAGGGAALIPTGTGASTTFFMRRADAATNTAPTVTGAASVADQVAQRGQVSYIWQPGDTDVAGSYFFEWKVIDTSGKPQTFPTAGFNTLEITDDLESHMAIRAALAAAGKPMALLPTETDIAELRELVGEPTTQYYSDDALGLILAKSDSIYEAAVDVWLKKAARYAALVDMAEVGSARSYSQLQDKALKMASQYQVIAEKGGTQIVVEEPLPKRPRLSTIQRTKIDSWPTPIDPTAPPGRRFGR